MKRCPSCNRTYTDPSLNFCLEDGSPLVSDVVPGPDPNATIRYTDPRDTNAPASDAYRAQAPLVNQRGPVAQQWVPLPSTPPRKKSNAVWWILGGIVVVGVIGVGLVVMLLALASMGSNSNGNSNRAANVPNANSGANRNSNTNGSDRSNENASANLPATVTDDFSEAKWGTGSFAFGDIWYKDGEYHMRSKDKTYLVMYAPTNDYNTANATVGVTARNVDDNPAASGYGLIVHGEKSKSGELEDYALLIYTGSEPQYEIIKHKAGTQSTVVPWAKASVIRSGTSRNRLEVRAKDSELAFYINGQYVDRITDSENFKGGVAGFYTSDTSEVAFDDLEIKR